MVCSRIGIVAHYLLLVGIKTVRWPRVPGWWRGRLACCCATLLEDFMAGAC